MARIKITGYIDTADIEDKHLDTEHSMGLSEEGHLYYSEEFQMEDLDFKLVT